MADIVELPEAYQWPAPITIEQFQAFAPEKLELVSGYLIDGPESTEARRGLLALVREHLDDLHYSWCSLRDDVRQGRLEARNELVD